MANIYDRLLTPEAGWKRINDTDNAITYSIDFAISRDINRHTNGTCHYCSVVGSNYIFYTYSSKIRIISDYHYNMGICTINIDDKKSYIVDCYNPGEHYQVLVFEKNDLYKTVHKITVTLNEKEHSGNNLLVQIGRASCRERV